MSVRMRVTAPCVIDGAPRKVGEIVEVKQAGEQHRLSYYGQAVAETDGKAVKATIQDEKSTTKKEK